MEVKSPRTRRYTLRFAAPFASLFPPGEPYCFPPLPMGEGRVRERARKSASSYPSPGGIRESEQACEVSPESSYEHEENTGVKTLLGSKHWGQALHLTSHKPAPFEKTLRENTAARKHEKTLRENTAKTLGSRKHWGPNKTLGSGLTFDIPQARTVRKPIILFPPPSSPLGSLLRSLPQNAYPLVQGCSARSNMLVPCFRLDFDSASQNKPKI